MTRLIRYFIGLAFFGCVLSCSQAEVYYKFKPIPNHKWDKQQEIDFVLDSMSVDTSKNFTLSIEISHNITYPYKNLLLLLEHSANDSIMLKDTIACVLVDSSGRWIGSGNGATRQLSLPYTSNIKIDPALHNIISVRHAMQDLHLKGIEKIGLKVN